MKLKIGIDARLVDGKGGGTKVYTTELIKNLLKYDRENFYILYTYLYHPNLSKLVQPYRNVKIREIKHKLLFYLPIMYYILYKDGIVIFHSPAYFLPLIPRFIKTKLPKLVVTFHGLDFEFYRKQNRHIYWRILSRLSARIADKVISVSNQQKNELVNRFKLDPSKISTIYYGYELPLCKEIPLSYLTKKYGLFLKPNEHLLLCVDGSEKRKNLTTILYALKILVEKYYFTNFKCIITRASSYYGFIQKLNLSEHVITLEWINFEDMKYFYKLASLVIYPSLYEGVGFPVIEAIFNKKPVLISKGTAMCEIINNEKLIIQEPRNSYLWASRILEILNNEKLRSQIIADLENLSGKFNWNRIIKEILNLYTSLIYAKK
jgi:Glycosyltransferase